MEMSKFRHGLWDLSAFILGCAVPERRPDARTPEENTGEIHIGAPNQLLAGPVTLSFGLRVLR
jgi:hypothetical protein